MSDDALDMSHEAMEPGRIRAPQRRERRVAPPTLLDTVMTAAALGGVTETNLNRAATSLRGETN